ARGPHPRPAPGGPPRRRGGPQACPGGFPGHAVRQSRHVEGHQRGARRAWPAQESAPRAGSDHGGELLVKAVTKVTAALALAWLAAGCTALRLAYDNADTHLHFPAQSYLDLDARGSAQARRAHREVL